VIIERQKLAAHAAPVAQGRVRGLGGEVLGQFLGEAALCGNVGEGVGGPVGEDVLLGDLKDGDAGRELVEATGHHGFFHGQDALAEAVVVPVAALEGPVDE